MKNEWSKVPLKFLVTYNENTLSENTLPNYTFDYVDISSVSNVNGIEKFQRLEFRNAPSRARRIVESGDVIISTVRTYLKATAQIPKHDFPIIVSTGFLALKASEKILSEYLKYAVQSESFVSEVESKSTGISYPAINASTAVGISIPLPPLPEQERIAAFLDEKCKTIDELTENAKEQIAKLKQYKQSIITETVTRGIRKNNAAKNENLKDSGVEWIGQIPEGWEVVRLKDIVSYNKGLPITKADLIENGVAVISYGQIHSKSNTGVTLSDGLLRRVSSEYCDSHPECLLENGDIVLADTSEDLEGLGNAVLMDRDEPVFAGYHTIRMRFNNNSFAKYFAYEFLSENWRSQLRANASGIKVFSVTLKMLNQCVMLLPPLSEQREIAAFLDGKCGEIDELISVKERKIAALAECKKSLIYEVVTGKRVVE